MVQTIQITASIPEGFVLVESEKFRELEDLANDPVWDLKDLKKEIKNVVWWHYQRKIVT